MELKDLIKKQDEELRYKANTSSSLGGFDLGVFDDVAHQNLKTFITKVRKETAEKVCDKMIRQYFVASKSLGNYLVGEGDRTMVEKEIKKQILKKLL